MARSTGEPLRVSEAMSPVAGSRCRVRRPFERVVEVIEVIGVIGVIEVIKVIKVN